MNKLAVMSGVTLLVACGGSGVQRNVRMSAHRHEPGTATAFSTPAELRLGFLRGKDDGLYYCAEPLPDVALGSDKSFSASLAASAAAAQAAANSSSVQQANDRLAEDNESLRRERDDAVRAYETDTRQQYTGSRSSVHSSSLNASANASLNAAAATRTAIAVSELAGRSPEVLLAREFLYRICEARSNGFFTDPKVYSEQQANALRLIQVAYEAKYKTLDASAEAQKVKSILDYNAQKLALCTSRKDTCDKLAAKDDDKKACLVTYADCLKNVELLSLPVPAKPAPDGKPPTATIIQVPN